MTGERRTRIGGESDIAGLEQENERLRAELECGGPHSAAEIHRLEALWMDEKDALTGEISRSGYLSAAPEIPKPPAPH